MSAAARIQARAGVLERGGRSHLVDFIHWCGERVGHLRELVELKRWRWVVYEPAGDAVGDEADKAEALRVAGLYLAGHREPLPGAPVETDGARPGQGDPLSISERNERGSDVMRWVNARGADRNLIAAEIRRKWGGEWPPEETP